MTRPSVLLDAGPLVSLLSHTDKHRPWAEQQFLAHPGPFLTCEAVLSEASFLVRRNGGDPGRILALLERGSVRVGMSLNEESSAVRKLFDKYDDIPTSLADACLIRMSELYDPCVVLTLDSDFHVYRRHGRQIIPLLRPAPR